MTASGQWGVAPSRWRRATLATDDAHSATLKGDAMEIKGRRIGLEELEARIAPAGGVVVTQAGGSLTITGDADDNEIEITQVGVGEFQIASGTSATTINGGAGPVVFQGVTKDLKFAMGEGDDSVTLTDLNIAGNLTFDGGNGANTLTTENLAVTKAVTVK